VYKQFYKALEKIGISNELRKEKNITFHSYRHLFNTFLLEAGIAPETVRLFTGHSAGMTARYSHIQLTNMKALPIIDLCPIQIPV
jgi:integrase